MKSDLNCVYEILSDHAGLQRIVPDVILSFHMRSTRPRTYVAEEMLRLGGRTYLSMVRHQLNPPSSHSYYVIGGDAKGSHIDESMREDQNGTLVTVTINWKRGIKGILGDSVDKDYLSMLQVVSSNVVDS